MAKPVKYPAKLRKTLTALPQKRERRAAHEAARTRAVEQERLDRIKRDEEEAADPALKARRLKEALESMGTVLDVMARYPFRPRRSF